MASTFQYLLQEERLSEKAEAEEGKVEKDDGEKGDGRSWGCQIQAYRQIRITFLQELGVLHSGAIPIEILLPTVLVHRYIDIAKYTRYYRWRCITQ